MSKIKIIAELGSCHMGRLDRIQEAILRCKAAGIDTLKLQLFPNQPPFMGKWIDDPKDKSNVILEPNGNVHLSHEMFKQAFDYGKTVGLSVTASVFDAESYYFLRSLRPEFIKFAYSQNKRTGWIEDAIAEGIPVIVSCDVMNDLWVHHKATKLYCIPEYPVRYEVAFEGLFPRFDGFSDHTLGTKQTRRAIEAGAKVIEKHVRLGYSDETCPDAYFAVNIEDLGNIRR